MPRRDCLDNATLDNFRCELFRRPMCHWATALLRRFTGDGYDLGQLFSCKGRRAAGTWLISKQLSQQPGQVLVACSLLLCNRKAFFALHLTGTPSAHSLPVHPESATLLLVTQPRRRLDLIDPRSNTPLTGSTCLGIALQRRLSPLEEESCDCRQRYGRADKPACAEAVSELLLRACRFTSILATLTTSETNSSETGANPLPGVLADDRH
jgi:hypothetical protein